MPQFTGLASKALSIAKKVAPIGGAARAWLSDPLSQSEGDWGKAIGWIGERLKHFKFANPITTTQMGLRFPENYPIMEGAIGTVGGWLLEELLKDEDLPGTGTVRGLATVWKKYSVSALVNGILAAYVYLGPFNPHGQGYTQGIETPQAQPSGFGDTVYRTRATSHIRSAVGQGAVGPR